MHGILFAELRKYVGGKYGHDTWIALLNKAGLGAQTYMPFQTYPDEEMNALIVGASELTGLPASSILEDFGIFIAPDLLLMYQTLVKPHWRTLDVLEHTEETIHNVVRDKNPGAQPPELVCQRLNAQEVVITYSSPRKLCAVAKGIATGLAQWYKEEIVISESSCMLQGDSVCKISVKVVK